MNIFSRSRLYIAIIIILIATNISTLLTVRYQTSKKFNTYQESSGSNIEIPRTHLGRFFRDELNLTREQHFKFREFRQQYHAYVFDLTGQMQEKRLELLDELSKEHPDTLVLNRISTEIGDMHTLLKKATNEYFLSMKNVCKPEQQKKLTEIFRSMLNQEGSSNMEMPPKNKKNSNAP